MTELPEIRDDEPLARHTTIGTGGTARHYAEPASVSQLQAVLAHAEASAWPVEVIGLGSNLLVHDDGVDALVLRLVGELASVTIDGKTMVAGGGATNAVCLHRARDAGLGGFEFAAAIPGTAGGGVRMNAGAYGSDWSEITRSVLVVDARGTHELGVGDLGLSYRHSGLIPGQVVAEVRYELIPRDPSMIRASASALLAKRKASQPTNKRTFGSVFKNPSPDLGAGQAIEACGLKGYVIGGAVISPVHANFIENVANATTADAVALMAEARRRVYERYGIVLKHEVRFLGPIVLPAL